MFHSDYVESVPLADRLRAHLGRRTIAAIATVFFEALILLAIWSLSQSNEPPKAKGELVSTFDTAEEPKQEEEKKQDEKPTPQQPKETAVQPAPVPVAPPLPLPTLPPSIPISQKPAPPVQTAPPAKGPPVKPGAPAYGPPNIGGTTSMDSKRVGTAPDGQPMYAASWYRKPMQGELDGYLSTAERPGYGTIACNTAPDYRVENCVLVDEYPDHSNYGRAVLAAAWQFKVRPPRIGGREVIGAWVRIRIYDESG